MLTSIWEDLKRQFNQGNMITRIILINVVFFVLANIANLLITIFGGFEHNTIFDNTVIKYFAIHQRSLFYAHTSLGDFHTYVFPCWVHAYSFSICFSFTGLEELLVTLLATTEFYQFI